MDIPFHRPLNPFFIEHRITGGVTGLARSAQAGMFEIHISAGQRCSFSLSAGSGGFGFSQPPLLSFLTVQDLFSFPFKLPFSLSFQLLEPALSVDPSAFGKAWSIFICSAVVPAAQRARG